MYLRRTVGIRGGLLASIAAERSFVHDVAVQGFVLPFSVMGLCLLKT